MNVNCERAMLYMHLHIYLYISISTNLPSSSFNVSASAIILLDSYIKTAISFLFLLINTNPAYLTNCHNNYIVNQGLGHKQEQCVAN